MSIRIDDLTVTFKNGVTAVDHVDLEIPHGIFGLLGENGAGKTTLMRVLTTVLAPTSGKVLLDGTLYCEANYEKIQKKIGYLPQEIDLYPSLTVRECLEYMGDLAGIEKRESKKRIDYYLEKTSLADHQKKKMRQLSGGMKRRVGLVQALLHEPDFLIVDELLNKARGHVWECCTEDESLARELERKYHISSKQYTEEGIRLRLLGENMPSESGCIACDVTLEDAYIYVTNR